MGLVAEGVGDLVRAVRGRLGVAGAVAGPLMALVMSVEETLALYAGATQPEGAVAAVAGRLQTW